MKFKHNKKRNTGFLFEAMVRELTKATIDKDNQKRQKILSLTKEFFSKNSILGKELELYKTIYESKGFPRHMAEKIIYQISDAHKQMDRKKIFQEQSRLVKEINKTISSDVFLSFVPRYKDLASIYQYLNMGTTPKKRVVLEEQLICLVMSTPEKIKNNQHAPADKLVYKNFVKRFNETYSATLRQEQKELLGGYITSFADNGLEFKIFLNEEVGRLKESLGGLLSKKDLNKGLAKKASLIMNMLNDFGNCEINDHLVEKVIKIQDLIYEATN